MLFFKSEMNADSIKDLFNPAKIEFVIPDYQRAYSWEKENIQQFIEDILDINSYKKQYYLGHFLFERNNNYPDRLLVIDGQQRLTTVVIFMSCIYYELKNRLNKNQLSDADIEEVDVERIKMDFLKYNKFYKLSTVSDDNPFFESVIYNNLNVRPSNRSQDRIAKAKAQILDWLVKASSEEIVAYKDIVAEAAISTFEVKGKFQATQIFAFQNDRGKDLTELEKLKAEIMHLIYTYSFDDEEATRAVEYVKTQFSKIFVCVERFQYTDEDAVLNAHNLAFYPSEQTAVVFLKRGVKDCEKASVVEWIKRYTDDILKSYQAMTRIEDKYKYDSKIADIQILDRYNSTPLLLKLYSFDESDEGFIESVAGLVERILFKLTFRVDDYRTNRLISIAREYQGERTALTRNLAYIADKGFKEYWNFNMSCHNYFAELGNHYNSRIKYVLWKYENALRKEKRLSPISPEYYLNQFGRRKREENTLDHITPQTPNFTVYSDEFKGMWLNNIGNLTLMGWGNNAAKSNNSPVADKEFFNTNYLSMQWIYRVLCEKQKWGEEEIKERLSILVHFVDNNWISPMMTGL